MDHTQFKIAVSETCLGQQVGNAMSINVLERIMQSAMKAAKLTSGGISDRDRWKDGSAHKHLEKIRDQPFLESKTEQPTRIVRKLLASSRARELIVDSGASLHLMDEDELSAAELKTKRKVKEKLMLSTTMAKSATAGFLPEQCFF